MADRLMDILSGIELAEPMDAGRLQVFGLRSSTGGVSAYRTLDESLADGRIEVAEVHQEGSVPFLRVRNHGEARVFLMAGEELVGAKQNRVLNTSIMVSAESEVSIPVSCVEAGRWRYSSRAFGSKGTSSHAALRRAMTRQVTGSYRSRGLASSNQAAVWGEVDRKLEAMGSKSGTAALHQLYEDHRRRLDDVLGRLRAPEGCNGAAFVVGGRMAGADLFDSGETLRKLWPKLVRSYALDAFEPVEEGQGAHVERSQVAAWLGKARDAKVESFPSPGLGEDMRIEGAEIEGSSLVVDGEPVHTAVFAR